MMDYNSIVKISLASLFKQQQKHTWMIQPNSVAGLQPSGIATWESYRVGLLNCVYIQALQPYHGLHMSFESV